MSILESSNDLSRHMLGSASSESLSHPSTVASPLSVSDFKKCQTLVEDPIQKAQALLPEFKCERDKRRLEELVTELRDKAKSVDEALRILETSNILPLLRESIARGLTALPGAVHSRQVCEFYIVDRCYGDELGVHWNRDFFSVGRGQRPYEAHDPIAENAGTLIALGHERLKAEILRRVLLYQQDRSKEITTFRAGPLVGSVDLDPAQLLDQIPASLRNQFKSLLQGLACALPEELGKKIQLDPNAQTPEVYALLRYATLLHAPYAIETMARAFPQRRSETLAFARELLECQFASESSKCAAARAAAFARPEFTLAAELPSPVGSRLTETCRREIMRFWLSSPAHISSLSSSVRELFVDTLSSSLASEDVQLIQSLRDTFPAQAKAQRLRIRDSQPYQMPFALQRAISFCREKAALFF
ncbi:MAG: hypothetical protein J0M12_05730 [Deltaproteobacteria bacterium]|nr:hypothetical protein [Deltaproteobacteria bacterium]